MEKTEGNFQLGLIAKIVSGEKNIKQVSGHIYLERKRSVITTRLATQQLSNPDVTANKVDQVQVPVQ
jgi:hypothetical protein